MSLKFPEIKRSEKNMTRYSAKTCESQENFLGMVHNHSLSCHPSNTDLSTFLQSKNDLLLIWCERQEKLVGITRDVFNWKPRETRNRSNPKSVPSIAWAVQKMSQNNESRPQLARFGDDFRFYRSRIRRVFRDHDGNFSRSLDFRRVCLRNLSGILWLKNPNNQFPTKKWLSSACTR